ncbi:MAG: hypothetical protein ACRERU_14560 [Methylococcales bacterium]
MNEAKSISIDSKTRVIKAALDFQAAGGSGGTAKKDRIQNGNVRILIEHELDLIAGRSIN